MAIRFQCSSCNKTLQVADTAAGKKARCPTCQTLNDVPGSVGMVSNSAPGTAAKPATTGTGTPNPSPKSTGASSSDSETILVACSNCGKASRVLKAHAGKKVQCPHCQGKIVVPGGKPSAGPATTKPAPLPTAKPVIPTAKPVRVTPQPAPTSNVDIFGTPAGSTSSNDLWTDLGDQSGGNAAWQPMSSSPANPYTPSYSTGGYGGGGYSPARRTERSPALYIVAGTFIALWGFILVAAGFIRIGGIAIFVTNIPPNVTVKWELLIAYLVGAIIGICMGGIQLFGGISMAMRNSLSMARTAAVVCTIPCFGGLCFPFGIWALVLLFSGSYKRDFNE